MGLRGLQTRSDTSPPEMAVNTTTPTPSDDIDRLARKLETLPVPYLQVIDFILTAIETRRLPAPEITVYQLLKCIANKIWKPYYARGKYTS